MRNTRHILRFTSLSLDLSGKVFNLGVEETGLKKSHALKESKVSRYILTVSSKKPSNYQTEVRSVINHHIVRNPPSK